MNIGDKVKDINARLVAGEEPRLDWREGFFCGEKAQIALGRDGEYRTEIRYSSVTEKPDGSGVFRVYCLSGEYPSQEAAKLAYEDALGDALRDFVLAQSKRILNSEQAQTLEMDK